MLITCYTPSSRHSHSSLVSKTQYVIVSLSFDRGLYMAFKSIAINLLRRLRTLLPSVVCLLGVFGCRGDAGWKPPMVKPANSVFLLELNESNADTFDEQLGHLDREAAPEPFLVIDGMVSFAEAVTDTTDMQVLAAHRLRLGDPEVPVNECSLLVVYRVGYAGEGRVGDVVRYYAFPENEGQIELAETQYSADETVSVPPGPGSFVGSMKKVRLLGSSDTLVLAGASQVGIKLEVDGKKRELLPGDSEVLHSASFDLAVVEEAVTADMLDLDANLIVGDASAIPPLQEEVEWGALTFSTTLSALYHGLVPLQEEQ